jgi:predicted nucleotidyltransferase
MELQIAPIVARSIERFRAALDRHFTGRMREFVLFGSQARGDATEESDIDLLVVLDRVDEGDRPRIYELAYDAGIEGDELVSISPLIYGAEHAADMRSREKRLMREIARDGIAL